MRHMELYAKFDENRPEQKTEKVGMLNPTREKTEGMYQGEEGKTPVTTACPEGRRGQKPLTGCAGEYS